MYLTCQAAMKGAWGAAAGQPRIPPSSARLYTVLPTTAREAIGKRWACQLLMVSPDLMLTHRTNKYKGDLQIMDARKTV